MKHTEGRMYGPHPLRVCKEKVAEFIDVTRDQPDRWNEYAPPGWAAAALFAVVPHLLADPDLVSLGKSVIHGEQRFSWEGPIPIEADLEVGGAISRVRERGGTAFVTFETDVMNHGSRLATGSATFLMSHTGQLDGVTPDAKEPQPHASGRNDPVVAGADTLVRRSASRADLVRYAAASRDWNPIHWDHQFAVDAGLPGVIVHGLLQAAWLLSVACRRNSRPDPFIEARFRFRSPLLAGAEAMVNERLEDALIASLKEGDREIASATIQMR